MRIGFGSCALALHCVLTSCASAPRAGLDVLVEDLADCDVVFLGEEHDNEVGHLQHLQIVKLLHERRDRLVVSMEMFERDVQPVLDRYLAAEIDEAEFVAQSRPWPQYAAHYRPLVEYCKEQGLPVIAANAPRALAIQAVKDGIEAVAGDPLVAAESSAPKDRYWEEFQLAMQGHGGVDESTMYRYYQSQCLKDDTMAESIVAVFGRDGERPLVVHVNGKFHSDRRLGTAARVALRRPELTIGVVSMHAEPNALRSGEREWLLAVPLQPSFEPAPSSDDDDGDDGAATEVVPGGRPALGFMPGYDDAVLGVLVDMLVDGGAAEKAGIQAGDVIIDVGGRDVDSVGSYMNVLADQIVGRTIDVTVLRGSERKTFKVVVGQRAQ